MRLFIAIELNDEMKDYLFNLQKELKLDAKIKWVGKKHMHLTLKFLGDVAEEKLNKIIELLSGVKFEAFEFGLKCLGVFDKSFPRVLFVDLWPTDKIMDLQFKVENMLKNLFEMDKRFKAHLTIGRIKFVKDKSKFLDIIERFKVKDIRTKVDSFCLIKSVLRKEGPEHTIIKEFKNG